MKKRIQILSTAHFSYFRFSLVHLLFKAIKSIKTFLSVITIVLLKFY